MIGVIVKCISCERKRNKLLQQLPILRAKAKQRAIENEETFVIYYDSEDEKLFCCTEKDATQRGYEIVEYVSKHL